MFKSKDKRLIIIAFSMKHAKESYMDQHNLRFNEVIVVSSLNHAMNYKKKREFVYGGGWFKISDIYKIQEWARLNKWKEIKYEGGAVVK